MSAPVTLLLVPGLMCDQGVWEPLLPALAGTCKTTVVDHGSADSLTDMARRLLDAAPDRVLLAGHSMGGRVVLEALRLAPQRIQGVALLDTGYLPKAAGADGEEEARKRFALLAKACEQGVRAMAREWVQGMVHPARRADAELIITMFERKSASTFECQIRALLARPDASDVLRSIRVPTLLMCGRQDSWSPLVQHQAMQSLVPGAQLEVIEGAGHMAPMERPDEVAHAMSPWLQRWKQASP